MSTTSVPKDLIVAAVAQMYQLDPGGTLGEHLVEAFKDACVRLGEF